MLNFKQLKIWQKGIEIAVTIFKLVQGFPKEEKFGLSSQLTRAAVSISSNIAEGSSRQSQKEYYRYIEITLGSAFELETQLLIAQSLGYGDAGLRSLIFKALNEEQKMLASFKQKLKLNVPWQPGASTVRRNV